MPSASEGRKLGATPPVTGASNEVKAFLIKFTNPIILLLKFLF